MASLEVKGLIDLWNHQPGVVDTSPFFETVELLIPTTGGAVEIMTISLYV